MGTRRPRAETEGRRTPAGPGREGAASEPGRRVTGSEPLVRAQARPEELGLERSLRPASLADYVGQQDVVRNLRVFLDAARQRAEALDHVLLYGPPGLGKTTLARIIAAEMGVGIRVTSGPAIERAGDLVALLTCLAPRDVLFVDEIHALPKPVEEKLYPAMEDYAIDLILGKGPSARTMRLDVPPFTLAGATTRPGLISAPLRDRFGVVARLDFYSAEELRQIVARSARILGIRLDPAGADEVARRSRGTPRIANRLLKRVRDFAQVDNPGREPVTHAEAAHALDRLGVDEQGLDQTDRKIIAVIIEKFGGGPVGIEAVAAAIREDRDTVEDLYEPYLLELGFIDRTPRGRVATRRAHEHFGYRWETGQEAQARGAVTIPGLVDDRTSP